MKLEVYRDDLKHEHRGVSCEELNFEHLRPEVQEVVRVVGRATFYGDDRRDYTVVYPPEAQQAR